MIRNFSYILPGILLLCSTSWIPLAAQEAEQDVANKESQSYIIQAEQYFDQSDLDSTLITFQKFFQKIADHPRRYPADDWAYSSYELAKKIHGSFDYELLTDIFYPLLETEPTIIANQSYEYLGKLINILAIGYKQQGFFSESIPIYNKAIEYFKLCDTLPPSFLPAMYINLGNALKKLGDLSEANKYYSEALRQIEKNLESESLNEKLRETLLDNKSALLIGIGLVDQGLGKHSEALVNFSESLEIIEALNLSDAPTVNNNMGMSFHALLETEKALDHFTAAIAFYVQRGFFDKDWVTYNLNLSDLLIELGSLDEADMLVSKTMNMAPRIQGVTPGQMATAYLQVATIKGIRGEYLSGVNSIDMGLSKITEIENPAGTISRIPQINLKNSPFKVIQAIKFRARNLNDWGISSNDSSKLMMALENYQLAEICIDSLRVELQGEESKINLSRLEKSTYAEKMDLLWRLYSAFPSSSLISEAFETIEKGKAAGLWNLIQLSESRRESLPIEIVKEEKLLKNQITDFDNRILSLEISKSADLDSIDLLKEQRFLLVEKLDSLINYINQNFPDYNQKKFQNQIFSIDEIKNLLTADRVMIQYFFSENYLHQIFVSRDSVIYRTITGPDSLMEQLEFFNDKLKLTRYDYSSKDVVVYQQIAHSLYKKLLGPFEELLIDKELIILPDESLAYIPFEALTTSDSVSSESDFRHLEYLIRQNSISYSYTASMWAFRKANSHEVRKKIFGIAPTYDVQVNDKNEIWNNWMPQLPELTGTIEEVEILKRNFGANTFSGETATENKFKESASDYKVLHMAMHTLIDEDRPGNSFLAFTPLADETEDGRLYPNEIRNLDLNSSLTILSACKSGTGRLVSGEGVMSISRMFILAGSSSVIMTLWSVDDQTSLRIIENLYGHLADGMSITSALRSSKRDFLNEAGKLHAHPFFWSGFIQLGRDATIQIPKTRSRIPWYAGGGVLAVFIITFLIYRKTKTLSG